MKNTWLIILISSAFFSINLSSQDSIVLNFSSFSNLDSIRIDNLSKQTFHVITENHFEIYFDAPSHIEPKEMIKQTNCYPNPFSQKINFEVTSVLTGTITMSVFNLSGGEAAKIKQKVEAGSHQFTFKPVYPGIYFLYVNCNSTIHTSTLICREASSAQAIIEYTGSADAPSVFQGSLKSRVNDGSENFSVEIGDLLKFTGYSQNKVDTKYDFLFSDKNYEFHFLNKFFKFKKYLMQESKPGLVDMVFSVSDTFNVGIDYLTGDDFIVSEDGLENSSKSIFQNIRKRTEIQTLTRTILLLDNSSKIGAGIDSLKSAAKKFVQSMPEDQELAIYAYSDSAILMSDFTNRKIILEYWIDKIKTGADSSGLYHSLSLPLSKWQDQYNPNHVLQGSLIVFSSGKKAREEESLSNVLQKVENKRIYAVTMAPKSDSASLKKIATSGHFYSIKEIDDLSSVFAKIQSDITRFSNSFYCLNYLSEKTEGEHQVKVSIVDNNNPDSSAYFFGTYNAEGFESANKGVFLNTTDTAIYGLDTIRCFANRINYTFVHDALGEKIISLDTLILNPVTYGALKTPVFTWELSKNESFKIESLPLAKAALVPLDMASDTVIITLRDIANDYSKNIVFIMEAPEFYDEMGIVLSEIKDSHLREISGMAASAKYPGYFWVHNDSGDDANVFLIDTKGNTLATVFIKDITSRDWEDIAVGPGPLDGEYYIYVGDIGDLDKEYTYKYIYRFVEPDLDTTLLNQNLTIESNGVACYTYNYADGSRDAEVLMIDPATKDLYIVTKRETHVQIYTLRYPQVDGDTLILNKSDVTLPFRMTNGGDISADGNEILIKNLTTVYYWIRNDGESIIETLSRKAMILPYIKEPQGEAIAWFRDGSGYLTVSEKKDNIIPLLYLYKR